VGRRIAGRSVASLFFVVVVLAASCSRPSPYPEALKIGADVVIETTPLKPGVPAFFAYRFQEKRINFFVVRQEGKVLAFLDACNRCYPKKLGFRHEGDAVVCKACEERYPVSEIEKGFGSCVPLRVEGRLEGDRYLIPAAELEKSARKF
jgi:uncharacterized membrane protein